MLFPEHFRIANYCLHHVYQFDGDWMHTFGDSFPKPDSWFSVARILGKVKLIQRGKRTIDRLR